MTYHRGIAPRIDRHRLLPAQRPSLPASLLKELPPDRPLRGVTFAPFPEIAPMAFHYRNPVSGRSPAVLLP